MAPERVERDTVSRTVNPPDLRTVSDAVLRSTFLGFLAEVERRRLGIDVDIDRLLAVAPRLRRRLEMAEAGLELFVLDAALMRDAKRARRHRRGRANRAREVNAARWKRQHGAEQRLLRIVKGLIEEGKGDREIVRIIHERGMKIGRDKVRKLHRF